MKYLHLVAFVVVLANPLPSNALNKSTEQAIKEVALDYAEGWYAGDPERMARALHSKLAKRALLPTTDNKFRLDDIGKETLVERTRNGGGKNIPKERRRTEVIIYDVVGKAAVVKLTMHDWVDFLQLIKEDGQWKIINVLWELNSEPSKALNKSTEQAIKEVALDYAEGWYAGNPERMARALHDTLAKRALLPTKDNKYRLDDMGKKRPRRRVI